MGDVSLGYPHRDPPPDGEGLLQAPVSVKEDASKEQQRKHRSQPPPSASKKDQIEGHIDHHHEEGYPVCPGEVTYLDQGQVGPLGVGQKTPREAGEQEGAKELKAHPEGGEEDEGVPLPEEGSGQTEEAEIDAQVKGQKDHYGDGQGQRDAAIAMNRYHDPVGDPYKRHRSREPSQKENLLPALPLPGQKEGNERHPPEGPEAPAGLAQGIKDP